MSDKEVSGKFIYEQDSKRFHRFRIETDEGVVGSLYIPKDMGSIPKRLILENGRRD